MTYVPAPQQDELEDKKESSSKGVNAHANGGQEYQTSVFNTDDLMHLIFQVSQFNSD